MNNASGEKSINPGIRSRVKHLFRRAGKGFDEGFSDFVRQQAIDLSEQVCSINGG
jgi:hypothetical protein